MLDEPGNHLDVDTILAGAYSGVAERATGTVPPGFLGHREKNLVSRDLARPEGRDLHPGCVMSFAYWDPRILQADRLLNSQTGEFTAVQITPRGREAVPVRGPGRVRPCGPDRERARGIPPLRPGV